MDRITPPVRKILHLDLDAFFCAVEEQHNPSLVGKAFAVGARPEERGVVASCSYAARQYGIRSAMPMARALQLYPQLLIIPSQHRLYAEVSKKVMRYVDDLTPLVEKVSIDEAFLEVTDLPKTTQAIAKSLQRTIHQNLNLPCSIGGATNKLVAKIANDVGKAAARGPRPPNAITIVPPGEEAAFLSPLPVTALWGVGPKTGDRLERLGVKTIGDLSNLPERELVRMFGKIGYDLFTRARGIDNNPIITSHEVKSISNETTFSKDIREGDQLRKALLDLSQQVARRLQKANLSGTTVRIKLRWADFTTLTRQVTLNHATDQDTVIYSKAVELFEKTWPVGHPVRLVGVGVSGIGPQIRQLSFWEADDAREKRLQSAVEILRQRYGDEIIIRGAHFPKNGA